MLFSFPSPYDQYYTRSEILICKTCFRDLSEEYFGMKEEEYQSLLSEVINVPQDEEETIITEDRLNEWNSDYLTNEPWWTEPIDVQLDNYHRQIESLIQEMRLVVSQSFF